MQSGSISEREQRNLAEKNSALLTSGFYEQTKHSTFARTLEEVQANEDAKIQDLYKIYLPYIKAYGIKFLKGTYFKDQNKFKQCQEIPEKYFIGDCRNYYFISHRWQTTTDPDPHGQQFVLLRNMFARLTPEVQENWGFWYDYSCLPQKGIAGIRTPDEEEQFEKALKLMHVLPLLSGNIMLFESDYITRAWCTMEWIVASKISPLVADNYSFVPFSNVIKFRHLAIVSLFLFKDNAFQESFMQGDDASATTHLNALIEGLMKFRSSTIENDKNLLTSLIYEHFWHHLRLLGFRTQLMTGLLILKRLEKEEITELFYQFLVLSGDPALSWTQKTSFVLESVFNFLGTPTDMIFHRGEIQTKSNTRSHRKDDHKG